MENKIPYKESLINLCVSIGIVVVIMSNSNKFVLSLAMLLIIIFVDKLSRYHSIENNIIPKYTLYNCIIQSLLFVGLIASYANYNIEFKIILSSLIFIFLVFEFFIKRFSIMNKEVSKNYSIAVFFILLISSLPR